MSSQTRALRPYYLILGAERLSSVGAEEIGNKAWNLMRMADAGLPVPAAFVLPTHWCRLRRPGRTNDGALREALATGISKLEAATGLGFGCSFRFARALGSRCRG
jgi:pyruvate,orthophosphate dikinase